MRTADYYRMSTDRQETSIPQQMAAMQGMIERENLQIVATYKDEGISGGENSRPNLQRLIAEAKTHRLEAIACYDLDRLSRSDAMAAMAEVFYPLKKSGVRWIVTREGRIDLNDIVGQTMLGLRQNFSCHQEKMSIADRTSRGRYDLWREGYWISNKPPYGYRIVERRESRLRGPGRGAGKLAIYEPEAAEVRRCFDLYEQLRSTRLVALAMGQSGDWVAAKLDRGVYCGRLMEPRKRRGKHYKFSLPERLRCRPGTEGKEYRQKNTDRWIEGVYPVIIRPEQFDRVQALLRGNYKQGGGELRRKRRDYLFSSLCWCGDCKKLMYARKGGEYYICGGHIRGDGCNQPRTVREGVLREAVIGRIRKDLEMIGGLEALRRTLLGEVESVLAERDEQKSQTKERLAAMDKEIAQARKGLLRLVAVSEEIYRDAVADVERMMREREELAQAVTVEHQAAEFRLAWARAVEATLAGLGSEPLQEKLLELVERIDLRWVKRPGAKARRAYRLAGGLIQYKTILGLPRLAAFAIEVTQRGCIPSNSPGTAGDVLPRRPGW